MAENGRTYLEDFLSKNAILPNEIRRNFELMRNLDTVSENTKEVKELQSSSSALSVASSSFLFFKISFF